MTASVPAEVRRTDDDELCGLVECRAEGWWALTVFGGELGLFADEAAARARVIAFGMRSLAERWTLIDGHSGEEQVVMIQQASRTQVVVALGYYSVVGVPSQTIRLDELRSGRWRLTLPEG